MTTKNFYILGLVLVLLVAELGLAKEQNSPDEKLIVDKTVLTINCENAPDSVYFQALLYGSSFENSELMFTASEFPYTLDILHGNFMGIVQVGGVYIPISVKLEVFRDGQLAAKASQTGKRILIRQRDMFPAAEVLD
jgi:hypothetical protein